MSHLVFDHCQLWISQAEHKNPTGKKHSLIQLRGCVCPDRTPTGKLATAKSGKSCKGAQSNNQSASLPGNHSETPRRLGNLSCCLVPKQNPTRTFPSATQSLKEATLSLMVSKINVPSDQLRYIYFFQLYWVHTRSINILVYLKRLLFYLSSRICVCGKKLILLQKKDFSLTEGKLGVQLFVRCFSLFTKEIG